jgi:hypothetical protein
MHISPITLGQTMRPMAPTIQPIGRVEKHAATQAASGRGRVSSSDTGKNSRAGRKRPKMNWDGLGETVDVLA